MSTPYRQNIEFAAKQHGISFDLFDALVWRESAYQADAFRYEPAFWERYLKHNPGYAHANPRRVSSSYGLAQVMYPVACEHGFKSEPEMLFLPDMSLEYGARHLTDLLKWACGDVRKALAAYNAGKGGAVTGAGAAYAAAIAARYRVVTGRAL